MDVKDKARILYRLETISQNTSNLESLLISLLSTSVLSLSEVEIIRAVPTTLGKYEALFTAITRKGPSAFGLLLQILARSGNEHIARLLDAELDEEETRRLNSDTELRNQLWFDVKEPVDNFCGRETEMRLMFEWQAQQSRAERQKVTIVCGLGGIGKSELVRTFAARFYKELNAHCVWIHGETDVLVSAGLKRLASHSYLNVPLLDGLKRERSVCELATDIFTMLGSKESVLILDNVEEISLTGIVDEVLQAITRLPPGVRRPFTILTTRNRELLLKANILHLDVWTETEALEFLRESLTSEAIGPDSQSTEAENLCRTFQFFPLALAQAASFISYENQQSLQLNNVNFGIGDYLQLYESQRKELLDYFPESRDLHSYAQTTFLTWNITLTKIKENKVLGPIAETLLNIIALFAPDSIQVQFLRQVLATFETKWIELEICACKVDHQSQSQSKTESSTAKPRRKSPTFNLWTFLWWWCCNSRKQQEYDGDNEMIERVSHINSSSSDQDIDKALQLIHRYSMVHVKAGEISVHRLVQDVIRMSLGPAEVRRYLDTLLACFDCSEPDGADYNYTVPNTIIEHIAHVKSVWTHAVVVDDKTPDKFHLVKKYVHVPGQIVAVLLHVIHYEDAQSFTEYAHRVLVEALGYQHPSTLQMEENLGEILHKRGQYQKALDVYSRVLKVKEDLYGEDGLESAVSRQGLAVVLMRAGDYQTSVEECQRALLVKEQRLGSTHLATLIAKNNLAVVLTRQGRYQEALKILLEVNELLRAQQGELHPDTLTSYKNLANALQGLSRHKEALLVHQKVHEARVRVLGVNHPDTLDAKGAIASSINFLGSHKNSLVMFNDVLEQHEKVLGADHEVTLRVRGAQAVVLLHLGHYDESLKLLDDVIPKQEHTLGRNHVQVHRSKNTQALLLIKMGRYEESLAIYTQILHEIRLGGQDPIMESGTLHNMAFALNKVGRCQEALDILTKVTGPEMDRLGPNHPFVLTTRGNIALTLSTMERLVEADEIFQDVYGTRMETVGPLNPDTLITGHHFGVNLIRMGRTVEGIQMLESVVERRRTVLGDQHPATQESKQELEKLGALKSDAEDSFI